MKTARDIRRDLRENRPTVGTWLQIPSADSAEIIARMGYDWAAVDMEHGASAVRTCPMFSAPWNAGARCLLSASLREPCVKSNPASTPGRAA